jgi:hypothetical protein
MKDKRPIAFTIPLWKWILLCIVPTHIGFDEEGNILTIIHAKKLFGELYVWRSETYYNGKLIQFGQLKRVNYSNVFIPGVSV